MQHSFHPPVSYVMPVLNEANYLEAAVLAVLAQQYPGEHELVLAIGPSNDGTHAVAERLAAADSRITVVDNPGVDIPIGLNAAIRRAKHDIIVRVDAHSELGPGYTERAVSVLQRTGAANVGGVMEAAGATDLQRAVARAYTSSIGVGGASYHVGSAAGEAESAYLGVFRRSVLDEVGGFDETLRRGEDWELNLRIRRAGHTVWFDPDLRVTYWPRETWPKLARQFFSTGVWRGELVRRHGVGNSLRFFVPPALVAATALSALTAFALGAWALIPWPSPVWLSVLAALCALGPLSYLLLLIGVVIGTPGALKERLRFAAVLVVMHGCWGSGFIKGAIFGAGNNRDTSRSENPLRS